MMLNKIGKNLKQFKLITFDVTDTLLTFRHPPSIEYSRIAHSQGYPQITAEKVSQLFKTNFKFMAKKYPNYGKENRLIWQDWWRMLIRNIMQSIDPKITVEETQYVADILIDYYQTDAAWLKLDKANELIDSIRKESAEQPTIGIISNFDNRLKIILENTKLPNFDFILASYDIGVAKPNPQIFHYAQKLTAKNLKFVQRNEALHIGNTPTLDYMAARAAGWHGILITNHTDDWLQFKEEINENHVFRTLDDFYFKLKTTDIQW